MRWRNPAEELPNDDDLVLIITPPHKRRERDILQAGCEMFCGWVDVGCDGSVLVNNNDELGRGAIYWYLRPPSFYSTEDVRELLNDEKVALAWMPASEFLPVPTWKGFWSNLK